MSRLAKKPIIIPDGVTVTLNAAGFAVKGPLGELSLSVRPEVSIAQGAEGIEVTTKKSSKLARSLVGTYASHMKSMIKGVKEKYQKKLILEGVGYKSEVSGSKLKLALGFSHPVEVEIPAGLTATAEKNLITISGIDKGLVGEFTAKVRALKKPEPYKGKGFRYDDEVIRRKQGKKSV
jgi:large subunit ribosomal protein L6